ncbi:MAG TPA: MaoC/PaaZ C-terminal domain-containing protein [Chloroflexota bacterium]|jgi:acyl dehydratase|nr:MaoC/PaaZ C-terminal domain-containing protein [Chloroflexota bacterium]
MSMYFEDFHAGQQFVTARRTVTEYDVMAFAGLSGDFNPLHTDALYAATTPYGERIAHGLLTLAITSGLINQLGLTTDTTLALLGFEQLRFTGAVRFGDTLQARVRIAQTRRSSRPGRGIVVCEITTVNQRGEPVLEATAALLLRARDDGSAPAAGAGRE